MNRKTLIFKRKLYSFSLFYQQIFYFSILIVIALSVLAFAYASIDPGVEVDFTDLFGFTVSFSKALPTYIFLGSLGLTHYVQNDQYYYYRNQGCTIISLISFSWLGNVLILGILAVLRYLGLYYV